MKVGGNMFSRKINQESHYFVFVWEFSSRKANVVGNFDFDLSTYGDGKFDSFMELFEFLFEALFQQKHKWIVSNTTIDSEAQSARTVSIFDDLFLGLKGFLYLSVSFDLICAWNEKSTSVLHSSFSQRSQGCRKCTRTIEISLPNIRLFSYLYFNRFVERRRCVDDKLTSLRRIWIYFIWTALRYDFSLRRWMSPWQQLLYLSSIITVPLKWNVFEERLFHVETQI